MITRLQTVLILAGLILLVALHAVMFITLGFEHLIGTQKSVIKFIYCVVGVEILLAATSYIVWGGPQ